MKIEYPNALRFILQDDLYLLEKDKSNSTASGFDIRDIDPAPQPEIKTTQAEFNYLGSNKKNFLILVNYPAHEFMPDEHLQALESVLTRKGHSRDDVAIFNIAKSDTTHELLINYFKPGKLLVLGETSVPEGMKLPRFNMLEDHSGLDVLYTFSFDEMMTNTANKKAFWEQIKML